MANGRVTIVKIVIDYAQVKVLHRVDIFVDDQSRHCMVTDVRILLKQNATTLVLLQGPADTNVFFDSNLVQISRTLGEVTQVFIRPSSCLMFRTLLHHYLANVHRVLSGWLRHDKAINRSHIVWLGRAIYITACRVQVLEHSALSSHIW